MIKSEWILSQLQALGITNPNTLWSALCDLKIIANPVPQGTIAKPIDIQEAFALIPDNEKLAISDSPTYRLGVLPALDQGRLDWVQDNITTLMVGGVMSANTAQALSALMAQTIPDPNWQSTIKVFAYVAAGYDSLSLQEVIDALSQ